MDEIGEKGNSFRVGVFWTRRPTVKERMTDGVLLGLRNMRTWTGRSTEVELAPAGTN